MTEKSSETSTHVFQLMLSDEWAADENWELHARLSTHYQHNTIALSHCGQSTHPMCVCV